MAVRGLAVSALRQKGASAPVVRARCHTVWVTEQPAAPFDLAEMVGGRRGIVDLSAPGVTLVVIDTFAPLGWAIVGALGAAAAVAVLRKARGQTLRQAGLGLIGLGGAAALAAITGDAKTYFLPGILLNAFWALVTIVSIIIGRPLLGYVIALIDRGYAHWQNEAGLRRAATIATAMWATVFTLRACVQGYLYTHDHVHWLAPARLSMGLPLWFLAVFGTLFVLEGRRLEPNDDQSAATN